MHRMYAKLHFEPNYFTVSDKMITKRSIILCERISYAIVLTFFNIFYQDLQVLKSEYF